MTYLLLEFLGLAAIIVVAGAILAQCADSIADITKLGKLLIGSILLAGATSLPEMSVDISAVRRGAIDLAMGDLMGSCLFNLLIVAIVDMLYRSRGSVLSRKYAAHALSATMSVVMIGLATLGIMVGSQFDNTHFLNGAFLNVGYGTWLVVIAYILGARLSYYDQRFATRQLTHEQRDQAEQQAPHLSLRVAVGGFVLATVAIILVAPWLAATADEIADRSGLGKTFVGTTLVALCTSLPELVATLTAVRIGSADLALGNIFGSNTFNMLLLLPLDFCYSGSILADLSVTHAVTGLCAILVTAIAVLGQLYNVEKRLWLLEPDATLMFLAIMAALGLIYLMK